MTDYLGEKMEIKKNWLGVCIKGFLVPGIGLCLMLSSVNSQAGGIVQCGEQLCASDYSVLWNGNDMGGGDFFYDASTGDISLIMDAQHVSGGGTFKDNGTEQWFEWEAGNGDKAFLNSMSGNADPVLGFGLGASTGSASSSFSFLFNLPVAVGGLIRTDGITSYSLTSFSAGTASVSGLSGNKIVQAWNVDNDSVLTTLNQGVDVGDTYSHTAPSSALYTTSSTTYSASNSIIGDLNYELLQVEVAFNLSAFSSVGISGAVTQTPVPVPAAGWLMISGLSFLTYSRRRLAI